MANDLMAREVWLIGQFLPWDQFDEDSSNTITISDKFQKPCDPESALLQSSSRVSETFFNLLYSDSSA
jgi:hypothetical protein